jgi:hypothetical protein
VFGGDVVMSGGISATNRISFDSTVVFARNKGLDNFLWVSGTIGVNDATARKAVFGGDTVVSGSTQTLGAITGSNLVLSGAVGFGSSFLAQITSLATTASLFPSTTLINIGQLAASSINVGNAAGSTTVNSSLTAGSSFTVSGQSTFGTVAEKLALTGSVTGTITFDANSGSIFYVNNPTGNITANFLNVPSTVNQVISTTVILSQSATPYIVSGVQIAGTAQTIKWANNVTPTGNASKQDVFGFSLIRSGSVSPVWVVLGQMSTYG